MTYAASHQPTPRALSRPARILLITFGVIAITLFCTLSAIAYAGYAAFQGPRIQISVDDRAGGTSFNIEVPAALASAGMTMAPWVMPAEVRDELRHELHDSLAEIPVDSRRLAANLLADLKAMPDATLVEVHDGGDHVIVAKRGSELRLRVESADADVDITVPLALADKALAFMDI